MRSRYRASTPSRLRSSAATRKLRFEVCARFGKPLAAPSANRFGRISPTAAGHAMSELAGRIPLIVDGGATAHGIESTIVAVENGRIRILRAGPVAAERLSEFGEIVAEPRAGVSEAPGQLESHYAPGTAMRILDSGFSSDDIKGLRAGLLAWCSAERAAGFSEVEILSPRGDLREAAATLFGKMRRLDAANLDVIFAEPVPGTGLGVAIMDRLGKASGRRTPPAARE